MMDLDRFKYVNDTLGHDLGDELLRRVAERLSAVVKRESDTIARLGGDEFAILLPTDDLDGGRKVAQKVQLALEAPMTPRRSSWSTSARAWASPCIPDHGDDLDGLVRRADVAMYLAKRNNTGFAIYDARYDEHTAERLVADGRTARGGRAGSARPVLPAEGRDVRSAAPLRRGADPLAASATRASCRRSTSFRSPNRRATSRDHHDVGPRACDRAVRALEQRGLRGPGVGEHLRARPPQSGPADALSPSCSNAHHCPGATDLARDHRERDPRGHRPMPSRISRQLVEARLQAVDRRLRHRLFVAVVSQDGCPSTS